jgi:translation initiation factor IF-2
MADSNDSTVKDTLKVGSPGRLQLTKTVESGKVKQNFTHGRSKSVTVEVRKTRTFTQGTTGGTMVEVKPSIGGIIGGINQFVDDGLSHLTSEELKTC